MVFVEPKGNDSQAQFDEGLMAQAVQNGYEFITVEDKKGARAAKLMCETLSRVIIRMSRQFSRGYDIVT
jgi:hypothetical protein